MIIVGITGTIGAGKGTVVELLKNKGFEHYSARAFIVREIERRGLPVSRDTMAGVANDLRAEHSPSYIIESLYQDAQASGNDAVIESIRTEGEIQALQDKKNFHLFAVDADPKARYQRIFSRGSATDLISFEKFLADEHREMHSSDPHKQDLSRCMELAEYRIMNDGTVDELHARVDVILREIGII